MWIMGEVVMRESILERHGTNAPQTYNRGTVPIDGIFLSHDLTSVGVGYLPFGKGLLIDQQCLWIDIKVHVLMGKDMEPSKKFAPRRLKCDDPRIRNKYLSEYKMYIEGRDIEGRAIRNKAKELQNSMIEYGWLERKAQKKGWISYGKSESKPRKKKP
jgi:hypothetical protein